jgi:hypothetical protein
MIVEDKFECNGTTIYLRELPWPPVIRDDGCANKELFHQITHMLNNWARLQFVAEKAIEGYPEGGRKDYLKEHFEKAKLDYTL